jgi:hypothetical protein
MSVLLPDFDTWVDWQMGITTSDRRIANPDVPADYPKQCGVRTEMPLRYHMLRFKMLYAALADGNTRLLEDSCRAGVWPDSV